MLVQSEEFLDPSECKRQKMSEENYMKKWMQEKTSNRSARISSKDLIESWIEWTPKIYKLDRVIDKNNINSPYDPRKVLDYLEDFIGPKQFKSDSTSCKRRIKSGELVFACRDCGVFSKNCFRESEHQGHSYSPRESVFGAICDCYGSLEELGDSIFSFTNEREAITLEAILSYAFDLFSMEQSPQLLRLSNNSSNPHCVVIYIDNKYNKCQRVTTTLSKCGIKYDREHMINDQALAITDDSYDKCLQIKTMIEEASSNDSAGTIKGIIVEDRIVVFNQLLACQLLIWASNSSSFKIGGTNLAETVRKIMSRDHCLWRASRHLWYQFVESTLTHEKQEVAKVFLDNYGATVRNFLAGDRDYSDCVLSLSRHIFSKPSVNYHLMTHHDALFVLLNTFITENKSMSKETLAKTDFIIRDLELVLSSRPPKKDRWTVELHKGFVQGVSLFLELLNSVQLNEDMDEEVANSLHNLLYPVSNLIVEWCTSNYVVFEEVFGKVLKALNINHFRNCSPDNMVVRQVAEHEASCIKVPKKPVLSIHLPLSRFLASLFLNLTTSLDLDKKYLVELIEPALRVQANIAHKLTSKVQTEFYKVASRHEMMDKDVLLLQIGAAILPSDEFLIHVLNKFDLIDWAQDEYESFIEVIKKEDSLQQTVEVVDEFLELVIKLIEERYIVGLSEVSKDECLRHKIIQRLSTKPLESLSDLKHTLPSNIYNEKKAKDVLNEIALDINGFFKLRSGHDVKLIKLPRLTKKFEFLVDILQCDVMIHLIKIILTRKLDPEAASFSESHLQKILHIINLALHEQESNFYSEFFSFTKRAEKHKIFDLLEKIEKTLSNSDDKIKESIIYTLNKHKVVASTKNHPQEN